MFVIRALTTALTDAAAQQEKEDHAAVCRLVKDEFDATSDGQIGK